MDIWRDLYRFVKQRKAYWLAPIVVVLLLLGIILVVGGGSALSPFIYSLF